MRDQRLGLGLLSAASSMTMIDAALGLGRESMLEAERANLLRQVVRVAANHRAVGLAAAAELRSAAEW